MFRSALSNSEVSKYLNYDAETGVFTWRYNSRRTDLIGKQAGTPDKDGYILIKLNQLQYKAHRLAWLLMTGKWPTQEVDHKNKIKDDNSWNNLRLATNTQQAQNTYIRKDNTSGFRGVCFDKQKKKWLARIYINKQVTYLGHFRSKEKANEVYSTAAKKHFGEFYT